MVETGTRRPGEGYGRLGVPRSHSLPMIGDGDQLRGSPRSGRDASAELVPATAGLDAVGPQGPKFKGRVPHPPPQPSCTHDGTTSARVPIALPHRDFSRRVLTSVQKTVGSIGSNDCNVNGGLSSLDSLW